MSHGGDGETGGALLEALSRLLDGDLAPEEATALRARIAAEPAVAQAWAEMQALSRGLDALPEALYPPPDLDDAVVAAAVARRGASALEGPHRSIGWTAALATAAIIGAVVWSGGLWAPAQLSPGVTLLSGTQLVEGHAIAVATVQGARVEVSGRARIQVDIQSEEDNKMTRDLLAAGSGAVLTVLVYEGTATITAAAGEAVTLQAGEERTFLPSQAAQRGPRVEAEGAVPSREAVLEAEVTALRAELAALRLERDLQQGALRATEGEPQPWPASVPARFREPAVLEGMKALVESHPDWELLGVDCEELPCLALIQDHSDTAGWMNGVRDAVEEQWSGVEDLGLGMWVSQSEEAADQPPINMVGIALIPPEAQNDSASTRTDWRMRGWLADAEADAADAAQDGPDAGE